MSVIDKLVINRAYGSPYGFTDMNRVGEAMNYVAERLRTFGFDIAVNPKTDFLRTDQPTVSVFDNYIFELRKLHSAIVLFQTTPTVPIVGSEKDFMTCQEANDIEKILLDIDLMIQHMQSAYFYSGDLHTGEV